MNGTSSFYKHPSLDVVARQQQPCYLPTEQAQQPPSYNQTQHFSGYSLEINIETCQTYVTKVNKYSNSNYKNSMVQI